MTTDFKVRLQALIDELDSPLRAQAEQDINALLNAGVDSYQTLVCLVDNKSIDERLRAIACWALGKLKDKKSVAILLKAFDSKIPILYWEASKALGSIKSRKALKPLVNILLQDEDIEKRVASAYALGLLRDKRAIEPLLRVLQNKAEQPKVRAQTAEALVWFNDRRKTVVDSLIVGLKDASVEVRFWSAFALGELKIKRAVNKLKQMAAEDAEVLPGWWSISREASNAIDRITQGG